MTSDGEALFRAICEQPQEDTPRLVFADWLEDNERPEQAEFIRLQIEARVLEPAYLSPEAISRVGRLLLEHGPVWRSELTSITGVVWNAFFVRGFVDYADVVARKDCAGQLTAAFAATPLSRLSLHDLTEVKLLAVLEHPCLCRLTTLAMPDLAAHHLSEETHAKLLEVERRSPSTRFLYNRR